MNKFSEYERWVGEAIEAAARHRPRVPYTIALREACAAAAFVERRWNGEKGIPPLSQVAARLSFDVVSELRSLADATHEAQTRLWLVASDRDADLRDRTRERARDVVRELEGALTFLFDAGDPASAQLAKIKAFHDENGDAGLAQTLHGFASLAAREKARLAHADGSFDPAWIDEANELAETLLRLTALTTREATDATRVRDGMLALLAERVASVRRAATRVFRDHPEVLREATSAYERRRRTARNRAKAIVSAPAEKPSAPRLVVTEEVGDESDASPDSRAA